MISIIVTAHNNTLYIKEALDSIVKSCGNTEYELLVGIDNCEKTLTYLNLIKKTFPPNIKILFFTEKVGTYIIRNTLVSISKYDKLLFFDSDDVMLTTLVTKVIDSLKSYDYVRYGYRTFQGKLTLPTNIELVMTDSNYHSGTFGIIKKVFTDSNGFEPWVCASDGEFYWRMLSSGKKIKTLNTVGLFYRRHESNLTGSGITGMNSPLRKKYHEKKKIKQIKNQHGPLNVLKIAPFIEVNGESFNDIKLKYINRPQINILTNKEISIIIPTFNNTEFMIQCLSSVIESVKSLNCEILVGIDNCEKTLEFIKHNIFDDRIRFFYFQQNVGPYIVKNTLVKNSNSNIILFFDSDDVMGENMVKEILRLQMFIDFVRPKYLNFTGETPNNNFVSKENYWGEGVFSIKKELFLSMNGFEGWRTSADTDFMGRLYKNNCKSINSPTVLFYRRLHQNSLTQSRQTGYGSIVRTKYNNLIENKKTFGPLPMLQISQFYEVFINHFNPIEGFDEIKHKKMVVNEVLSNILTNPKLPKTKVDYDLINKITQQKGVYIPVNHIKPIRENKPVDRMKITEIKKDSLAYQSREFGDVKKNKKSSPPNIFSSNNRRKG